MTDVPPGSRPAPPPGPEDQPEPTRTRVLPPDRDPGAGRQKQRFADRVWSLPAVIAIVLVSVVLGGLGGAALASAGDDDRRRHFQRDDELPPKLQRYLERRQEFLERRGHGHRRWSPGFPDDPLPTRPPRPTPSS